MLICCTNCTEKFRENVEVIYAKVWVGLVEGHSKVMIPAVNISTNKLMGQKMRQR
jgi:hypothetical protein